MRTIGLIGGTGWVSTAEYYRLINQFTNERLGGLNAARMLIYSVNYADIDAMNKRNDKLSVMATLKHLAQKLEQAGADLILLGANTLHEHAEQVEQSLRIPLNHIADATAEVVKAENMKKVGLLGTKFTMEMDFYRDKLRNHGIDTLIPEEEDRLFIHQCINEELLLNQFHQESKDRFVRIIEQLGEQGAEGIVLGCTEIPLLIKQADLPVKLFNTTEIHARAAVNFACK